MEPHERLEEIQRRAKEANAKVQKFKGKYEQAEAALESVRQECRDKKIDPDKIDTVIEKLEERFDEHASKLEKDIERTEKQLAPFLGE